MSWAYNKPDELKIAKACPIYKKNRGRSQFSNYRSISILPSFSKLYERLVCNRLMNYLSKNSILYNNQYGIRSHQDTSMGGSHRRAQTRSGLSHKNKFRRNSRQNVHLVHFSIGHFICCGTIKCGLSPVFHWCLHILKQTCARRQRCRRPGRRRSGRRRPSSWWHCKHETTTLSGRILAILTYHVRSTDAT